MKRGDYMIHVMIEQVRQIKCPPGTTVDPLVQVTVMNEKKFTTAKDDISATGLVTWNEHLFFEPRNVKVEDIEQAKISIQLMDKGYFKDAMIGSYEFDVAYIYFMEKHSLMHRWVALSNPASANFNEVAGYMKLSITIAATGDEQIQITEDVGGDKSDEAILMPPSIRPEYYQIRFKFFRAENLPAMDTAIFGGKGSIDAYLLCNYMNKKLKTQVITAKEGEAVDWNTEFLLPCSLPIMSSRVVIKLFDEDKISDEIVGSLLFNLKECIGDRNGKFFWKNIYGSPLGCSGENTKNMNANPEMGSTWKGRILMQVTAEKTEKPQCLVQPCSEEDIMKSQPYTKPHEYEVIMEVGQGVSLPSASKYKVMIKIGDLELTSGDPKTQEGTYNRWSYRSAQTSWTAPYPDVYDIGKVFIYLMSGKNAVSFYKEDIEHFMDPNPKFRWIELLPDCAMGKVTEHHKAGIVSVKVSIHDKTLNGPINFKDFASWKKDPPKRLGVQKVRAFIYQCRDVPAADDDGQSDPYIKIWDQSKECGKRTKMIEDNLNPLFYEAIELSYEANKPEDLPPFLLDIYDWDMVGGDDFIARSIIKIEDAAITTGDEYIEPKWHPMHLSPGSPACGEVLISFAIVEDDFTFKKSLKELHVKDYVTFKEFEININILGLRELQSVGILPVKKAFIIFNLKSLVPPEDGSALENIKTQPGAPGPNPTINTLIKFNLPLPTSPLFCPRLSCSVHDNIFKGFSQPLMGSFIIPVGDLIHSLAEERRVETEAIEHIIEELEKIAKGEGAISYVEDPLKNSSINQVISSGSEEEKKSIEKVKSKMTTVDDEMKKPLILGDEMAEKEGRYSDVSPRSRVQTQRVTPRNLTAKSGEKSSKNPLKQPQIEKFNEQKGELLAQHKEEAEKNKRALEDARNIEQQELKKALGADSVKNVLYAKYKFDTRLQVNREVDPPPESLFMGLGWDETPDQKRRHYRRYYPDELENIKSVMPVATPFNQFEIKRGQSRGASKGLFGSLFGGAEKTDDSGATSTEQVVGKFKGIVTVESEEDKKNYQERKAELIHQLKLKLNHLSLRKRNQPIELNLAKMDTMEGRNKFEHDMEDLGIAHLKITKCLADLESDETLKRMLMNQSKCIVRVYMISAYDLASRDNGSFSDPYLIMTMGNKVYNERSIYQNDEPNPEFNKYYDFEATFPGCPPLNINVMDYDDLFGDDSIGSTSVDLEDRFFSPEWQSIKNKPIEYRQLYHPSTSVSQGVVKCWIEINPTSVPASEFTIFDIRPKPAEEFEVRVCVFDTQDIKMDETGTCDPYFRCFFDSKEQVKETDTHFRCQNGKASYNYRLLFDVKHPRKEYNLTLQIYDRDFFKSNEIIGETVLNLKDVFLDCSLAGRPLGLNKSYYNAYLKDKLKLTYKDDSTFWVELQSIDDKGKKVINGKVRIQIDIVPKAQAETNKVGEARNEPNTSPFLPPPIGRLSLSLNPFKMFQQLVGPAMRRKIYCYCCLALCLTMCIFLIPLVFGNIISSLFMKLFGL